LIVKKEKGGSMSDNITPSHIANFFLKKAGSEDLTISPMKLIKLAYIGYGWTKAILNEDLFEEGIEAWKHGPVIPSLYHEFKEFRDKPITCLSMQVDDFDFTKVVKPEIDKERKNLLFVLDYVWDVYKGFTGWSLRDLTHKPGTPWEQTYKEGEMYLVIDRNIIKEHFEKKIAEYVSTPQVA
jgi:uncharacterized phage-associated protein